MLRFRSTDRRPTRNYFSRREQWRLFLLILPLGLVIVLMRQLRDPENGARLNRLFADDRATVSGPHGTGAAFARSSQREVSPDGSTTALVDFNPQIDRNLLSAVEDNTYFRNAEQGAWFHLLEILQETKSPSLGASSTGVVGYMQLVEQPHVFRGRLVTVRGDVRQITKQMPAKNGLGINAYYRVVIQPDGGAQWPIFIYCLDLPANLAADDAPRAVSATGFFFKNLSYKSQTGLGIAPVILAKSIDYFPGAAESLTTPVRHPVDIGERSERPADHARATAAAPSFEEVLALAGWDVDRLAKLGGGDIFSEQQLLEALELLRRLRTLDRGNLDVWTAEDSSPSQMESLNRAHPGQLVRLKGRVMRVIEQTTPVEASERLEMRKYYECELALDDVDHTVTVITSDVPSAWLEMPKLDQPAGGMALFVRELSGDGSSPTTVFLARRLEWFPDTAREPFVSLGESLLGMHGMDVGLLEDITNHHPVLGPEREAFYQMLAAMGQIGASQLARFAQRDLQAYASFYQRDLESTNPQRRLMAREVVTRAAEGRYSVAPLFNDADSQIGQLLVFDGVARRVTRVEVGVGQDGGGASDVLSRFGIDHYYEIELFTDDSQNRPIVFCVRDLPVGFPTTGSIDEPVRLAGFFFKSWHYHTHESPLGRDGDELSERGGRPSIAPLLIGRAPIYLPRNEGAGSDTAALVGGSTVLLAVLGVWATVWWWGRSDRQFFQRRLAGNFSLPAGHSLDELRVSDRDLPISSDTMTHDGDANRGELE